jgi:hypothetical protein
MTAPNIGPSTLAVIFWVRPVRAHGQRPFRRAVGQFAARSPRSVSMSDGITRGTTGFAQAAEVPEPFTEKNVSTICDRAFSQALCFDVSPWFAVA